MKKFSQRTAALSLSLVLSIAPVTFALPVLAADGDSNQTGLPAEVTGVDPASSGAANSSSAAGTTTASDTAASTATASSTTNTNTTVNTTSGASNGTGASSSAPSKSGTTSTAAGSATPPPSAAAESPTSDEPLSVSPVIKGAAKSTSTPTAVGSVSKVAAPAKIQAQATTTKLYGRIEQITASNGASFPVILKAMTPQLDLSMQKNKSLQSGASQTTMFSGTLAKSFPQDYRGNWGGDLTVWRVEQDPICYKIDPEESSKVLKIFKNGAKGSTNFMFAQDVKGGIVLAPAKVMFQVPGGEIGADKQMAQMLGGQSFANMGPMGAMMQQMAKSMPVSVIFSFGDIQSSQFAKGLSGNEFVQRTLKNQVRELAPNVLEQQIVAECNEIMRSTGQPRKRYEESVLRFTKVNSQQMYVQAAQVVFGGDRKFQQKIIMYGYVTKGQVANTNPYSGMMQMMQPGQSGAGQGFPGLSPGQNPFGGGGQSPQLPPGFNPFQGLFGQ